MSYMRRKSLIALSFLLLFVGCVKKNYEFTLSSDVFIVDQSREDFSYDEIKHLITLTYGEEEISLDDVSFQGSVDLEKIGNYPVSIYIEDNNKSAETSITVSVVDRKSPTMHLFEEELLIHVDEDVNVSSKNFLIYLTDGINGQINERIKVGGDYNLDEVATYQVELIGTDFSGNEERVSIPLRVTDIMEEKALYLYKKARLVINGDVFIFKDDDKTKPILNFEDSLEIFTESHKSHYLWFSGLQGDYQPKQSGAKITLKEGEYYADYSLFEKQEGYKNTKLKLTEEGEDYLNYIAESTYEIDGEEVVKLAKFNLKKVEGVWRVDEFYLQY